MAGEDSAADAAPAGGVLGSIKGLAATLIAAVHTRLQLFTTELALEGLRLRRMLLLLILAVIFFALALGLLTLLVVLVFWDGLRSACPLPPRWVNWKRTARECRSEPQRRIATPARCAGG